MTNPGLGQSTPVEGGVAVSLLEVDPEIGRFLSTGERAEARRVAVPVRQLREGTNGIDALLEEAAAFGALLLDGMVLQRARIGDQVAVWLLGGGDMISLTSEPRSMLLYDYECETIARTRIALLGREVLGAIRRWPGLGVGLHVRVAEQHDRLAAQLVVCQLPRVDQRLMTIMCLLAESWGHGTSAGTVLPVALTHNA